MIRRVTPNWIKNSVIFIVMILMLNITLPALSQSLWQRAQEGLSKGVSAVGQAIKKIDISQKVGAATQAIKDLDIPGKVQNIAQSTASKVKTSLTDKLEKLKNTAPNVIIPALLNNVEKLGQQISHVANCMATGNYTDSNKCSSQDRAALIAIAITVLALTAALVGFTIGIAATSQEVDEQMAIVSQEVKGWSPQAIFIRLKNVTAQFKQNIVHMNTCLLKRQCTATQKKILYGTAGTIVALATIAVGIGVGSYLYAHQKEKARTVKSPADIAAQQAEKKASLFADGKALVEKPSTITTLQEQLKSNVATIRDKAKQEIAYLEDIAKDWKSKIQETVTPMQQYFQKQVIEKGSNAFQETATKMQNLLAEQKETAQQALKATTAELQATLIEKARAVEEKIKETAQAFFTELQQGSQSFLEAALQNILNIKLSVVQPTIQKIQELITRVINALKPLNTVRLKDQLMDIVNDLNIMLNKSTQLQNDWQTAITQIAQRTAWIQSHIRPTWAGGKTNEEIAAEAKTLYPLAAVADDIWNFYPHIIAKVNNLKLYGPALIFDSLVKRTAELLREMQVLNISMGKIGQAIISAELSGALQELEVKLVRLGENIKTAANIKPILSNPPATTSQALMEAFKGFAWRVGFDLPNKMNSYLNKMLGEYNRLNPVIEQIIEENNILTQLTQNMTTILKQDVLQRIADKPVINSARLPLILAQSLGLLVTQMKAVINDVLIKTDTVLEGLTGVLDDAKPMIELVNNAFGGTFINPALIQGLDTVKDDVHNLRPTMQKVRKGITDAIKIPFGV